MKLIAAPSRVMRQVSTWVLMAQGILDLCLLSWNSLVSPDLHFVDAKTAILGNIVLTFFAGVAKVVQQQIPLTIEQKEAIVESVHALPTKETADDGRQA